MNRRETEIILEAFAAQLEENKLPPIELLICGGAALNLMGFIDRATKDIDVVASIKDEAGGKKTVSKASLSLPSLNAIIATIASDFDLPKNWLNSGPESVLDLGMPEGFLERVETRTYGKQLTIHLLGRRDQIFFKFY